MYGAGDVVAQRAGAHPLRQPGLGLGEIERWDDLVVANPDGGNILQSRGWGEAKYAQGWRPRYLIGNTNGDQVAGGGGVVFDVAAEADDEVVDGASVGVFVDAPHLFKDLFAGDDLAFAFGEVA